MIKINCPKVAKNLFILLIVSLVFAISISTSAYALTSENINFQGKIVRNDTGHEGLNVIPGTPACVVDGAGNDTCDFQVAYYTAATAGTLLLTETFSNVEIGQYDGVFELSLGSGSMTTTVQCRDGTCNTPMEVISEYTDLYVELKFAPDGTNLTETFTRMPLEASAYSIFSKYAEGAHDAFKLSTSISSQTQSSPTTGMVYYNTTDSKVQLYNGTSWENISGESLWTDAGTFTYLTSATDDLVLGATTVSDSTFFFDMDASSGSYFEIDDASNTNRLFTILSGGNVGIGTATPGAKLEVAGASSTITNASGDLTISTGGLNGNILLSPHGTGSVRANSPLGIRETGTTPTFYTYLQGGDQAADITYTLPTSSSTGLLKNTAGVLSWDTNTYITGVNWSQVSNGTGIYMDYKPNDTACTGNQVLKYSVGTGWICADDATGSATAWDDISDPDASSTIVHGAFSTDMQFDSFTSGSAFKISSTATGLTGSLLDVSLSGSNAANTGSLLTLNNTGTLNTGTTLLINHYATGTGNLAFRVNDVSGDTTPFVIDGGGNVGIGTSSPGSTLTLEGTLDFTGVTGNVSLFDDELIGDTTNGNNFTIYRHATEGDASLYFYVDQYMQPSIHTSGTRALYMYAGGYYFRDSGSYHNDVALTSGGGSNYASFGTTGSDSLRLMTNNTASVFIDTVGNVGIGESSPTAYLHLKAGTTAANTAPLKFTTGVNLTTAESGAMEWDGSRLYITDTTPTRNTIAYTSDIPTSDNYQYWTARADSGTDQNVTSQYILDLEGSGGIATSIAANKITIGTTGVLEDLNTLGAATAADQFIVSTAAGVFAYESGSTVRTSLGATTVGSNLFTLTNPSAITFLRINADNTVSALNASDFRTAIGAGTGSGTVTSVTAGTGLTADTNPITTTGTISFDYSKTLTSAALGANVTMFGSTGVLFEGSTSDGNMTLLTVTDPTGDNTITLPNSTGTVALTSQIPTVYWSRGSGYLYPTTAGDDIVKNTTGDLGLTGTRWDNLFIADSGSGSIHIGSSATDEGIISYDTSNNILKFDTDSTTNADISFLTDDLYLDKSAGRVGIGITTPGYILDVAGSVRLGATGVDNTIYIPGSGATRTLYTSGDGLLTNGRFQATGDLISSTKLRAPVIASGSNSKDAIYIAENSGNTYATIGIGTSAVPASYQTIISNASTQTGLVTLVLKGITSQTGDLFRWIDSSNNVLGVIDVSGDVGIGTTSPDYALQVNGVIAPETDTQDLGTSALSWDLYANAIYDSDGDIGGSGQVLSSTATGTNWTAATVDTDDQTLSEVLVQGNSAGSLGIDMNNNLITNIGNANTDFTTGGGLTLATTLGLRGSTTGNFVSIGAHDSTATWTLKLPQTAGTDTYVLKTDGSGNTYWGTDNTGAGGAILSSITAATTTNTINSGDNGAQIWNWALTTADRVAFTFGESSASTATGTPVILSAATVANSTAIPLFVKNYGNATSFRVDDVSGDTTPFVIDASGNVGIGTASPGAKLELNGNLLFSSGTDRVISIANTTNDGDSLTIKAGSSSGGSGSEVGGNLVFMSGTGGPEGSSGDVFMYPGDETGQIYLAYDGSSPVGDVRIGSVLSYAPALLFVGGGVQLTNIYDGDGSNFFDLSGCGTTATVTGIDSTGAVTCSAITGFDNYGYWTARADSGTDQNVTSQYILDLEGSGGIATSIAANKITIGTTGVLEDLNTLGAATAADQFIVSTAAGVFAYESGSTVRTSLGATTVGSNLFTLTNPSAITFLRVNADNTVSALNASDFRTAIGAGTGSGTVTSVATGTGLTGGTITTTGTISLSYSETLATDTLSANNTVFGSTGIIFEGTTDNTFQTLLTLTDPTADRTITLPNATGTVALTSDLAGLGSLFTDSGTITWLTSTTDDFSIGGNNTLVAPLSVDVSANTVRIGTGATANAVLNMYASDGDTGSITYNTNDAWAFSGGNMTVSGSIVSSSYVQGTSFRGGLYYVDDRIIAPADFNASEVNYIFTTYGNNDTSPYADGFVLRGYYDASGGSDNMLTYSRSSIAARMWQQTYGSATAFTTYEEFTFTGTGGTANYIPKYTDANTIGNSGIYDNSGNIGIGTTSPDYALQVNGVIAPETDTQDLGTSALSWDLYANAIYDSDGDIGTSGQVLSSTSSGTNWVGATVDTDDQRWNEILAPNGDLSLAHLAYTTSFTFDSITTATAYSMSSSSLTTGNVLGLSTTSTALTTGGLLNISATGAPAAAWSGSLAKIEYDNADADVDGSALKLGLIGTTALGSGTVLNITTSQTGTGALALRVNDDGTYTDTTPFVIDTSGNVGVGTTSLDSILKVKNSNVESPAVYIVQGGGSYITSNSNLEFGASNSDGTGFPALASVGPYAITVPSSSMEFSSFGRINTFLGNGAPAGSRSVHNIVGYQEMTGQDTNANKSFNLYLYSNGGASNTSLGGTPSHTNIKSVVDKSSGTSPYNVYGIYSSVAGNTSNSATGYGIYTTISGFGSNYAIYSAAGTNYFAGNVGIGQPSPTAYLHLKAGTTAANTAPLKFTTGVNLTTAESGAMEWDGSRLYMTNTTPTRNTIAYNPMTSAGDIIYGGTSGVETRLAGSGTDGYVLKYNTATNTPYWAADSVGETGSDVLVAIDGTATAGYLGAAYNDGVLRSTTELSYEDGGDYITLGVADDALDFTELQDTLDLDTSLTLNQTTYTWGQDFTGTTTTGLTYTANSLTSGTANLISSNSTAGITSGSSYLLRLTRSGANSNTAHTAYGVYSTVTNTNATSGTNIGGYFSASGATTANYGLIVANGNVGIGTTSPNNAKLVVAYTQTSPIQPAIQLIPQNNADIGTFSYLASEMLAGSLMAVSQMDVSTPPYALYYGRGSTPAIRLDLWRNVGVSLTSTDIYFDMGDVGIGTSSPDFPLQVNGTIAPETYGQDLGNSVTVQRWDVFGGTGDFWDLTSTSTDSFKIVGQSLTTGNALNVVADSLTSGSGLKVGSTATTGLTGNIADFSGSLTTGSGSVVGITANGINGTGNGLKVTSSTTGALTNGLVYVNGSAAHTGNLVNVVTATATGVGLKITANSLTTGNGLNVSSTATGLTGNLVNITTATQTGIGLNVAGDSITTGTVANLSSASTAGTASNTSKVLNISRSGANTNLAHTAYGIYSTVTNTNATSGTNVAGYFSASGATTANYGLLVANGNVGIGTTSPDYVLQVNGVIAPETDTQDLGTSALSWDLYANAIYDSDGDIGTSGQVLSSTASGTNWVAAGGSGTVTNVATGVGLTGGPITTTGTISLDYSNTLASNSLALNNTVFGSTGVLFEGATSDTFETLLTLTDPTADNTITLQNNSGIVPLGTAANTLFFTTTGATNVTLPTSGTLATTTQLGALTWADIDNGTGVYIDYKPNNIACTGDQVLKYTVGTGWLCGDDSTGTTTAWDEILDPTTNSSIAHGAYLSEFTFNTFTSGSAFKLTSESVLGTASSSSTVLEIARSGANSNTAHTAYGVYSTVTNTNATSGTNIGGYFSASGATTANYGLLVANGNVGIGTTTPSNKFVVNTSAYSTIELQYGGTSVVDIFSNASSNIFIGLDSGSAIYTGTGNIALGDNALSANTTGSSNTALGHYALDTNVAKQGSTAVGYQAMMFADSTATAGLSYNTAIGYQALTGSGTAANNTGTSNTAVGHQSLTGNTTGSYNVGFGANTLNANTTGTQNVAIGYNSLFTNVAKQGSVAIGYEAMRYADSTGTGALTNNTAIGYQALYGSTTAANNTGTSNVVMGSKAMYSNTSGSKNVVMGDSALYTNTTGGNNLALGYKALYSSTGGNNIAIGYQANDLTSFTGTNNIIIGHDIDMPATTSSNMLNIGNLIFATGVDGTGQTLSNGKVGIGTTLPTSMFSVGLSSQFQVDSSGDLVKVKNVTYAWPSSNASGALVNNGSGTLSWTAMVTGSGTGSATAGQATFWNGTKSITGDDAFWWDNTNKRLGIGTTTPASTLDIGGSSSSIANSSGDITINAAEDLIIDSKVGIGTSGTFDPKLAVIGLGATSATTNTELLNSSSTSLFKVLDDGKISFSANVEFSKDGTNWIPMGATTKTVLLSAEYPGAVLSADGTANIGSMTSDSESSTANAMNYYEWSSSETSLNDYDVRVRFQLPSDFDGWGSGGVQFYYATESTSAASNKADFYIYEQSSGTADGSSTAKVSSTAGTWTSTTIAGSGLTACVDSGDVCVFVIRQYSTSDNYVRVGDINITYDRKL